MTTDAQSALAQVREALAAGPTPGPWVTMPANAGVHCVARINAWEAVPPSDCELSHDSIDASFIAACSPANMTAILAHVEAQEAEIKRLRKLAMSTHLFEEAPCFLCGYSGPGYYQPEQHPCAALYHEAMEEQR